MVLLPVGILQGRAVLVSEIPEDAGGILCSCVCPLCGGALLAIRGSCRNAHFTHVHVDGVFDARDASRFGLLLVAEEILRQERTIRLPGFEVQDDQVEAFRADPEIFSALIRKRWVSFPERKTIESIGFEQSPEIRLPELHVVIDSERIQVDIRTRRAQGDEASCERPDREGAVVEIDLSRIRYEDLLDRDALRSLIVHDTTHKSWRQAPRLGGELKRLQETNRAILKEMLERRTGQGT